MERRLEEVQPRMTESLHGSATRTARSLGELQQNGSKPSTRRRPRSRSCRATCCRCRTSCRTSRRAARSARSSCTTSWPRPCPRRLFLPGDPVERQARRLPDPAARPAGAHRDRREVPAGGLRGAPRRRQPGAATEAARQMRPRRSHIKAIAERYIIEGETADGALMFLPSEAVYAELHANLPEVVRAGFAARVWIVSPTTCMATLNTMRAVLKDARMRAQAGCDPPRIGTAAQGCGPAGGAGGQSRPAFRPGPAGYRGHQGLGRQGRQPGRAAGELRRPARYGRAAGREALNRRSCDRPQIEE
jgi:DNA recombination protein RmuC